MQCIVGAEALDIWRTGARNYKVDNGNAVVSGYSMGGFGTYRLLARWPDLFARGFSVVGAPGSVIDQLASLRNTPLLTWHSPQAQLANPHTHQPPVAPNPQDWANSLEPVPGVHIPLARSTYLTCNLLRGVYLAGDPSRRATFNDFRAGWWYAFTR